MSIMLHALLTNLLLAILPLPPECRVNKNPGNYCTWTCIDTLARKHSILPLRGLLRRRWTERQGASDPGHDSEITKELDASGVNYKLLPLGSDDRSLLPEADTLGVIIAFKPGTPGFGCHSVLLTGYADDFVYFYDPNTQVVHERTREWFDKYWYGNSCVIYPG